jgi:diguanylate cyclase (GGDEF)-like protein
VRAIKARSADAPSVGPALPWRSVAAMSISRAIRSIRFASAPAIATPRAMAKTSGMLYICAASMSLVGLVLPQRPGGHRAVLIVIALLALAVGIALVARGQHWPRWCYHLLILNGTLVIALSMYEAGGGRTSMAYASLYMFVAVNCFFFFAWPSACLHLGVVIAADLLTLWAQGDADFGQVVLLPGTLVVVAVVVGRLVRAADAAEIDTLTGLPNRRGLDRHLGDALADASLGTHSAALAFLDVDHFRSVNNTEGQGGGDRLLRAIAAAWRPLLRDSDFLARNGSDEFALLITDALPGDVAMVISRLREAMPKAHTCSAGASDWQPGDTVSMLAARTDKALYESKRNGRNRLTYHDSSGNSEEAQMRRAVADGEIVAYYQPIVELGTGVVTGFEALARWIRPGHGLVAPDAFIPAAEANGAIEDIGSMMLAAAAHQVAIWSIAQSRPLTASVNVCGRELRNPGYVAQVKTALRDAGLPASQLVLELTETAFEGNAAPVIAALEELHGLGIGIAIDDFGTGYSSLSRLDRLPVDVVKIDRSFVSTLPADATRAPLVAAIIAMARALGLHVVAEGIEHPHQCALLFDLGCDKGQGYWFDRPCPADEVDLSPREPAYVASMWIDPAAALRDVG